MTDLLTQINIFIIAFTKYLADFTLNNPLKSILVLVAFVIFTFFVTISKKYFLSKKENNLGVIIPHLISPFLVYSFTHIAYINNKSSIILLILNNVVLFWLLMALSFIPYFYIKEISKFKISFISPLLVVGLTLNLVLKLLENIFTDISSQTVLLHSTIDILIKIIVLIFIYFYLKIVLFPFLDFISLKFPSSKNLKVIFRFPLLLIIVVGVFWFFDIVTLNSGIIFGFSIFLIFVALSRYFISNITSWVYKIYSSTYFGRIEQIRLIKNAKLLVNLMLGWFYINTIFILLNNYGIDIQVINIVGLIKLLSSIYIVKTDIIKISLVQIIYATWLFFLLKTMLFMISKYLRVIRTDENDDFATTSLESLTSNVGTLIIITLSAIQLGITWKIIIPVAGAIGIGVGVGIQGILNNYVSGFILLFSKKVKIGDIVELEGNAGRLIGLENDTVFGKVKAIDIFATTIKTFDNVDVAVPNSLFISDNIVNYTQEDDIVRVRIPIGVSYLSDVKKVKSLIMEAVLESNYVIKERNNDVWFYEFGDSSLNFYALCWVDINQAKHPRNVRVDVIERVWYKFKDNDVEIPYPQQDIWFRNELKVDKFDKKDFSRDDIDLDKKEKSNDKKDA